ncbi:hypothetical protein IB277_03860 [Ensifer sp. ENS07]|uniref:hypothetical protein n=1 Tax=Ensifer sp. ENS07 TaxID=2769274 RepID=UPI00177C3507|nr:hypothetical protein [Ensifer sp. ENS07]MBD9635439.1 hypothetical protein [Ensifer sp. ENS07]
MSDKLENPYGDQFLHDALEYVAKKTSKAKCPFCGNPNWTYENGGGLLMPVPKMAYIPMRYQPQTGQAASIPVFTLTCTECGFVRHHNLPMIMTKLDGNDG